MLRRFVNCFAPVNCECKQLHSLRFPLSFFFSKELQELSELCLYAIFEDSIKHMKTDESKIIQRTGVFLMFSVFSLHLTSFFFWPALLEWEAPRVKCGAYK